MSRKACKSIWRAMRRGHPVDFFSSSYKTRKETSKTLRAWNNFAKKELSNGQE